MNTLSILLAIVSVIFASLALYFYSQYQRLVKKHKEDEAMQKEQFYEIVHELRAPLTAVKDAAFLLSNMAGSLPPEQHKQLLSLIKTECTNLLDQVTGVLDASKVMSNKLTIEKTPNDLKKLIQEKVLMYTPQAKNAEIELAADIDPVIGEVLYDARYMSQVMNNLISNSLKYTPKGGKITVSGKVVDNSVEVAVFDNGAGIATEAQKQLFSKFGSLNHDVRKMSSGLGLYVVKGIIEAHGGKVLVETKENRGYKVSFTLPFTSMPASLVGSHAPAPIVPPPAAPAPTQSV